MAVLDWISGRVFHLVHGNNLVYNTCWEDPRLDRIALDMGPDDEVLVITSAGCNALDYALTEPRHVYAVDMNPRQNALLELKLAGIRKLEYEDFFSLFGTGRLSGVETIYAQQLRSELSTFARDYWDRCIKFFDHPRRTFYFRGTAGAFARAVNVYIDRICKVRPQIEAILSAEDLDEQQRIYHDEIEERFWSRAMRFAMNRDTTLSMVGVPKAQRRQVESQYEGGIVQFVQDCVEAVFANLPLADNYFWRVYLTGHYTEQCCPEYLKAEGFQRLKDGLVDRVSFHTNSVQGFLSQHDGPISRFVLLDHMDWLSDKFFPLLELEWQAIIDRAATGAKAIWRSGGLRTDFLDRVRVSHRDQMTNLSDLLTYNLPLAEELHRQDRVHTYGSFYIADVAAYFEADQRPAIACHMGLLADLRILYHLTLKPIRGKDHAARLESFYAGQAAEYDDFRKRLLQGREAMWAAIDPPEEGVWVDMGGGTGANLEYFGEQINRLSQVYLVDLSPSLLEIAQRRCVERGWQNVQTVEADATLFRPPNGTADVVTFSYSLTMIPDWFAALENALAFLKPGGLIGVVDFYVSRKYPADGLLRQSWFTRHFWPIWFSNDNVFPSPDHVPFLHRHFDPLHFEERRAKVPYLPSIRTPYYQFVGRKRDS